MPVATAVTIKTKTCYRVGSHRVLCGALARHKVLFGGLSVNERRTHDLERVHIGTNQGACTRATRSRAGAGNWTPARRAGWMCIGAARWRCRPGLPNRPCARAKRNWHVAGAPPAAPPAHPPHRAFRGIHGSIAWRRALRLSLARQCRSTCLTTPPCRSMQGRKRMTRDGPPMPIIMFAATVLSTSPSTPPRGCDDKRATNSSS